MSRILATAAAEFRIGFRNRWVAIAMVLMAVFSLVLSLALVPWWRPLLAWRGLQERTRTRSTRRASASSTVRTRRQRALEAAFRAGPAAPGEPR